MEWIQDSTLIDKSTGIVPIEHFKDTKCFLFYFSALFDKKSDLLESLKKMYRMIRNRKLPIELIFISMDESEEDMLAAYETHSNWVAIKYGEDIIPSLVFMNEICSVPKLIVKARDGSVISRDGIADIEDYGTAAAIAWTPIDYTFTIPS